MKGMAWVSPRGPMSIDPATRDAVNTVYIRKVELKDGHYWNIEFDKVDNVKDPGCDRSAAGLRGTARTLAAAGDAITGARPRS